VRQVLSGARCDRCERHTRAHLTAPARTRPHLFYGTTNMNSLEGGLTPMSFTALTRTK
jgi:hypothetical protein